MNSRIYEYHGWREQCKHITEEIFELTEAIHDYELCKSQPTLLRDWNNIAEEVADVEFMLEQIKDYYLIQEENITAWKDYKRKRETDRINSGYYTKK